jgi:hypothetical protein
MNALVVWKYAALPRPDPFRCVYGAWQLIQGAGQNEAFMPKLKL